MYYISGRTCREVEIYNTGLVSEYIGVIVCIHHIYNIVAEK